MSSGADRVWRSEAERRYAKLKAAGACHPNWDAVIEAFIISAAYADDLNRIPKKALKELEALSA